MREEYTYNVYRQSVYIRKIKERATKKGFEFNLTLEYLMSIFNGKCALSGLEIQFGKHWKMMSDQPASLDRIDNTKGYIIGNVQFISTAINYMKNNMSHRDTIKLCNIIAKHVVELGAYDSPVHTTDS